MFNVIEDAGTRLLMKEVSWFLQVFFNYDSPIADRLALDFYDKWKADGRHDDEFHRELPYRLSARVHFENKHESVSKSEFRNWFSVNDHRKNAKEFDRLMKENYDFHPSKKSC